MFPFSLSHRKIKNAIIGNQTKKSSFMLLGVIPRLVEWERGKGEVGKRVGGRGRRKMKMEGWRGEEGKRKFVLLYVYKYSC